TSRTMTSGLVRASSSACRPFDASDVSKPAARSVRPTAYRLASLSSTTSTHGSFLSAMRSALRLSPADFDRDVAAIGRRPRVNARNLDPEGRALSHFALDAEHATEQVRDCPREGETEAGALHLPLRRALDLAELLEDALNV